MNPFIRFSTFAFKGGIFVKDKMMVFGFMGILTLFWIGSLLDKDLSISKTERRTLAQKPSFTVGNLLDGTFFTSCDTYVTDQFPFRDSFRKEKSLFLNTIYRKRENHGSITIQDGVYQLEYSLNKNSISYFTKILNSIQKEYFPKKKVYYAIIPDKNYYVTKKRFPKLDYNAFYQQIREQLSSSFHEINIKNDLNLNSYYRTDLHWKQEKLEPVLKTLQREMQLDSTPFPTTSTSFFPFYGAYYSKASLSIKPDTITYLSSKALEAATVYNYEKKKYGPLYQKENLSHIDSYDIFLDGPSSLLILENKEKKNQRTLLLFRDSFGSSLAPLFLENYSKIVLIDLRYFASHLLSTIPNIDFNDENQDILFLYSVPIVNESSTLK